MLMLPAFFAPSWIELTIVVLVVLLLFGNRLPSVMRSLGSSVTEFKKGVQEADRLDDDLPADRPVEPKAR